MNPQIIRTSRFISKHSNFMILLQRTNASSVHCSRVPRKPPPHLPVEQLSLFDRIDHPTAVLLCPPHQVGYHLSHRAIGDNLVCFIPVGTQRISEVVTHPKQLAKGHWTRRLGDTKVPHPVHIDGRTDRYTQVNNVHTPTHLHIPCMCVHIHTPDQET